MNFRFIAKVLGQLQVIIALSMGAALAWSIGYRDGDHWALIEAMVVTGGLGAVLWFVGRRATADRGGREPETRPAGSH